MTFQELFLNAIKCAELSGVDEATYVKAALKSSNEELGIHNYLIFVTMKVAMDHLNQKLQPSLN